MNLLETVFEWVVSTTIRASLVAVAILAIQMTLRPWMPAKWRHPLWLPLLLVMVLPFVPELPVHLLPAPEAVATVAPMAIIDTTATTNAVDQEAVAGPTAPASRQAALLPILWLAGVLVTMTVGITGYRMKLRAVRAHAMSPDSGLQAQIEEARKAAGLAKTPLVWLSRRVESPAVSGLLRPVLLLPVEFSKTFTATESRLILLHEFSHIKRHDLAQNWLLFALQALHWFNPVIWFAFARVRIDRETACDARVLALDAEDRRSDYGHALLRMQDLPAVSGLRLGFLGIFENVSGLRTRISDISRHRRSHPAWQIGGSLLVMVIALFGSTRAEEAKRGEVAEQREAPSSKDGEDGKDGKDAEAPALTPAQAAIAKKLDTIMLPNLQFQNASFEEVIDFLRKRSVELDSEPDPARKGVNFVVRKLLPGHGGVDPGNRVLTVDVKKVSLRHALDEICTKTDLTYAVDDFSVTILPPEALNEPAFPPAPRVPALGGKAVDAAPPAGGAAYILNKAKAIIVPQVKFKDTSMEEAVDFLRMKGVELDKAELDPGWKGINFLIRRPRLAGGEKPKETPRITLEMKDVSIYALMAEIAKQTGMRCKVDDFAFTFVPLDEKDPVPLTREQAEARAKDAPPASPKTVANLDKARNIVLPILDFENVSLEDAVMLLNAQAKEHSKDKSAPEIMIGPKTNRDTKINSLHLRNLPLSEALRYCAEATKTKFTVNDEGLQIGN